MLSYENKQSKRTYFLIDPDYELAAQRAGLSKEGDFWVLETEAKSAIGAIEQGRQCRVVLTEEQRIWISNYEAFTMEKSTRVALAERDTSPETLLSAVMLGTLICVKEDASAPKEGWDALKQQLDAHQNKGAVAVLYGSDQLGDVFRFNIGRLCDVVLTDDGPVMMGKVKGLRVVDVNQFDHVKAELEKMQEKFRNKWKQ